MAAGAWDTSRRDRERHGELMTLRDYGGKKVGRSIGVFRQLQAVQDSLLLF